MRIPESWCCPALARATSRPSPSDSDQGVEFGLAGKGILIPQNPLGVGMAIQASVRIFVSTTSHRSAIRFARITGMGFRHDIARVLQMHAMPIVRITAADAGQVRTGALGAPQERAVIHRFAGH